MDKLLFDLRSAARALAARPAFTVVAALALALGIGANTAIFSVVHAVLLRPLPYRDAERLAWITAKVPELDMEMVAGADYLEWRDASRTLASIAAYDDSARFTLKSAEQPERIDGAQVSASFLPTLGVEPAQGRGFLPEEEKLNAGRPAVLSHRLWERLFGADTPLQGQTVRLDDDVYTVVGVLPRGFLFPRNAEVDLLVPLVFDEAVERGRRRMMLVQTIGRLKPGVSLAQAYAELKTIRDRSVAAANEADERAGGSAPEGPAPGGPPPGPGGPGGPGGRRIQIAVDGPGGPPGGGPRGGPGGPGGGPPRLPEPILQVTTLREHLVGDVRPALLMMLGAVGLVLLIACANVANLLLARATARRQEIAIRATLGAGRWRIARLLLTESGLLGLLGGACGLVLAFWMVPPLVARMPADLASGLFRQTEIQIDAVVLAFTLLLSLATSLLFGLAPAFSAARFNLTEPLKEGARGGSHAARRLLVAAEVALAVVLLVGAGLLLRSFLRLQAVDTGFDPEGVLTLTLELDEARYGSPAAAAGFFQELERRVRALPGVESVSFSDSLPLGGFRMILRGLQVEGQEPLDPAEQPPVGIASVGPGHFRTLGIRLLRGRPFQESDNDGALPVAIVSESMARKFWGDQDPVGKRFQMGRRENGWTTVVGVAGEVKYNGLEEDSSMVQLYRPLLQQARPFGILSVRAAGDPAALTSAVRREILALDRNVPVSNVVTMEEVLARSVADRRFSLTLLGLFAILALLLAAIGLYGVLAYAVTERTHEIGIRMALGAERRRVLALILRQGLTMAAIGIAVGLPVSLAVGRLLRSSLYGVTALDPLTLGTIPLVLLGVALLSSLLPAWRATQVSPMVALRED
ncbi:MAG TPA: ABC transporter permease [Thermoanaerobaculia bacterium]